MNKFKAATVAATGQMQLLGAAFLKALPWIGALVAVGAILYGIYQKIYNIYKVFCDQEDQQVNRDQLIKEIAIIK